MRSLFALARVIRFGRSVVRPLGRCLSTDQFRQDGAFDVPRHQNGRVPKQVEKDQLGQVAQRAAPGRIGQAQENPAGPSAGTSKVVRGGDWTSAPYFLRVSTRSHFVLNIHDDKIGFRLFKSIP